MTSSASRTITAAKATTDHAEAAPPQALAPKGRPPPARRGGGGAADQMGQPLSAERDDAGAGGREIQARFAGGKIARVGRRRAPRACRPRSRLLVSARRPLPCRRVDRNRQRQAV